MTPAMQRDYLQNQRTHGILLAIGAAFCLPLGDAFAKSLTLLYPIVVIAWMRFLVTTLVVGTAGRWRASSLFATQLPGWQLLRAVLTITTTVFYYQGLSLLPLADCTAIIFLAPLWAVGLARLWLREPVTPAQWAAVVVSLIGTALIMQPDSAVFRWAVLWPLAGSLTLSGYLVVTRRIARTDSALTTTFLTALSTLICFSVLLPHFWVPIERTADLALMVVIGLLGAVGQQWTVMAYRRAPTVTIAPLGYLSLVVAIGIGYFFYSQVPEIPAALGMACIVISGLTLILYCPSATGAKG